MNRNLKRVLSLALMMVVLAVNFVIPAFATGTTISVSYTDLLNNTLLGGQGTLFFDTSAGTTQAGTGLDTPQNNYNRDYAPLEVWSAANRASLNMKGTEWARFEVEAATAGYYAVDATYGCGVAAGADFVIRTESAIIETHLAKSGANAYAFTTAEDLGYVYLEAGTNYIYVDNKSTAQVNFKGLDLTLDTSADGTLVAWIAPVESANEIADYTVSFDDGYNQAAVDDVTFTMDIPVDGKYQVSVMGVASAAGSVSVDFGGDVKSATVNNDTYGYTAIGVFPLTEGEYTMTVDNFTDNSLAWVKVEYVSPYETGIESESFVDGDTVARGTDNLTITFNDNMMDTAAATLNDGEIPVDVTVDGANVIVSFLETLDYETEYTLTVTGLQGVNDAEALEDRTYTFTTADETNTDGEDDVTVTEVTSSREDVTIEGIVKGSTGHGIKGRTVTVTSPEGAEVATVTSGDDGVFTAEFTIADGTDAGAYNYTVTAEYGATATATVSYVSEEEELRILDLFLDANSPEEVYAIFETYGEILLVPTYEADCDSLADADLFLGHFEGKDFAAVSDVAPFYAKMLKLEGMNQATLGSYIVSNYLNDAAACELIGIASDKLALVNTTAEKNSFAAKVAQDTNSNGASTSEAAFLTRIEALLDAWLLETNNITATSLDLTEATTACRYAGEIAIPLDFVDAQTKVKTIVVTVTTAEAGLLANAQAVVDGLAPVDAVIDGDTATFTIDFEYDAEKVYDEVGKISLQASVIATHEISVDATVTYRFAEGDSYAELPIAVAGGTIRATVSPAQSSSPSRPSSGNGYVAPPKEKPVEDDNTTKSKYFFDDMGEALWAQDMVHVLATKGIISKNDERAFRPMDNITREEYVKMLVTVIGSHKADAKSTLSDVSADHWATSYIATAQQLGIVQGNADGTFGLGQKITRQDMAVMLYRTFKMLGIDLPEGTNEFTDSNDIASYAKAAVSALEKQGIINGMGDGTFAPANNATRAQSAKVIYSMMEVLGV
ncbi:MAG: S-layer homology domain-containing protein [Clostridia bacterium]|nr:S-layer homology domain-containing protein [Clostridia bacterium]